MKRQKLRRMLFLALCCDLGLFSKRLISPAANVLTDFLHIPGGVGTSFSLLFLVLAVSMSPGFGCGTLMGAAQSIIALCMGMTGSMGVLAPLGYILPGFVIDCVFYLAHNIRWDDTLAIPAANMLAAVSASLAANLIVFRLSGVVLLLYLSVSLTTGAACGMLGVSLARRLRSVIFLKG